MLARWHIGNLLIRKQIFLYGGYAGLPNGFESPAYPTVAQGLVYVLSLPSFHWIKHNNTPPAFGRWLHSCNVVGSRQMVSIGGKVVTPGTSQSLSFSAGVPDPWPQGLGIFDMSEMEWKSEYDPSAPPYVTPDVIQNYYSTNGRFPASWSNPTIEGWFKKISKSTNCKILYTALTFSKGSEQTSTAPKHSSHPGTIAGGVVGGTAVLALIASLIYLYRRRAKKSMKRYENAVDYQTSSQSEELDGVPKYEMKVSESPGELYGSLWRNELPVSERPSELATDSRFREDSGPI
jgi:hypothetical protein